MAEEGVDKESKSILNPEEPIELTDEQQARAKEFSDLKGLLLVLLSPSTLYNQTPEQKQRTEVALARYTEITGISKEERLTAADRIYQMSALYEKTKLRGRPTEQDRINIRHRDQLRSLANKFTNKEREAGRIYALGIKPAERPVNVVDLRPRNVLDTA